MLKLETHSGFHDLFLNFRFWFIVLLYFIIIIFIDYIFLEPCVPFNIHLMVNAFGYLLYETFEDTREVIRSRKSKTTRGNLRNTTQKTRDWTTRSPLETGGELSIISGTRRVTPVTNPVINYEWGKDRIVITTNETYLWSFVTQIFPSD